MIKLYKIEYRLNPSFGFKREWTNIEPSWYRGYNLPANVYSDGYLYWYKNGVCIKKKEET